jgi:ABC-type transporter Mla subunit MlaD
MSEQEPKKKPKARPPEQSEALTVTVLLALVLSLVGYYVFFSENNSFILKAKFTQAYGLKTGAEVQCAGVKVGAVKDIRFLGVPEQITTNQELFELILELSPTINGQPIEKAIHKDATAIIIIVGSLGDRGVNIVPGTPNAPPVVNGDYILGKIDLSPAMVSANVQEIRKKFNTVLAILDANAKWVNEGNGNIGKSIKPDSEAALNLKKLLATTDTLEPLLEKSNPQFS